jgi:hypothetical protein
MVGYWKEKIFSKLLFLGSDAVNRCDNKYTDSVKIKH